MIHVILPSQHVRRREPDGVDARRRLMLAVLRTAFDDCCDDPARRSAGARAHDSRACRQAVAYVESRDRSWPFSFENLCDAVGLDAESVRRGVRSACRTCV